MSSSQSPKDKDVQEKIYEISKDILCSFANKYPIEEFNKPSIRERASYVSVLVAKTLLTELGYYSYSDHARDPQPNYSSQEINNSVSNKNPSQSTKPNPDTTTVHPDLMRQLREDAKKKKG